MLGTLFFSLTFIFNWIKLMCFLSLYMDPFLNCDTHTSFTTKKSSVNKNAMLTKKFRYFFLNNKKRSYIKNLYKDTQNSYTREKKK